MKNLDKYLTLQQGQVLIQIFHVIFSFFWQQK